MVYHDFKVDYVKSIPQRSKEVIGCAVNKIRVADLATLMEMVIKNYGNISNYFLFYNFLSQKKFSLK